MLCMVWNWSCCMCVVPRMWACLGQWRTVPKVYGLKLGTQKILGLLDWSLWWRNGSNPKGLACWLFTIECRGMVIAYCWINEAGFLVWRCIKDTVWANSIGAVLVREQFSDHNIRMRGLWWKFFHVVSTFTQGPREGFAICYEVDSAGEGFTIFLGVWGSGLLGMTDSSQQHTFPWDFTHSGLPLLHKQYDCESCSESRWHKYDRKWQS